MHAVPCHPCIHQDLTQLYHPLTATILLLVLPLHGILRFTSIHSFIHTAGNDYIFKQFFIGNIQYNKQHYKSRNICPSNTTNTNSSPTSNYNTKRNKLQYFNTCTMSSGTGKWSPNLCGGGPVLCRTGCPYFAHFGNGSHETIVLLASWVIIKGFATVHAYCTCIHARD